jgi:hypothetical protein
VKNHLGIFLFGLGLAFAGVFARGALQRRRCHGAGWREPLVDINSATREQLMSLGIVDSLTLDRLEESRPYRNKLELVSRMLVTDDVYERIKRDIVVRKAREPIKVAG